MADRKKNDFDGAMADWYNFSDEIKSYYGVDMGILTKPFAEEQEKFYIQVTLKFFLLQLLYLLSVYLKRRIS